MEILNKTMANTNPLATLLADPVTNHIGYVYSMDFKEGHGVNKRRLERACGRHSS